MVSWKMVSWQAQELYRGPWSGPGDISSSEAKLSPTGQNSNEESIGANNQKKAIWRCFSQEAPQVLLTLPLRRRKECVGPAQDGWLLQSKEDTFEGEPPGSRATLGWLFIFCMSQAERTPIMSISDYLMIVYYIMIFLCIQHSLSTVHG